MKLPLLNNKPQNYKLIYSNLKPSIKCHPLSFTKNFGRENWEMISIWSSGVLSIKCRVLFENACRFFRIYALRRKKPGFLPNLLAATKYFCKKPGF